MEEYWQEVAPRHRKKKDQMVPIASRYPTSSSYLENVLNQILNLPLLGNPFITKNFEENLDEINREILIELIGFYSLDRIRAKSLFQENPRSIFIQRAITTYLRNEKSLERLREDPHLLETASPEIKDNYPIVLSLVKKQGLCLQFASERLKDHIKIVEVAMESNCWAYEFASHRIRSDPRITEILHQKRAKPLVEYYFSKYCRAQKAYLQLLSKDHLIDIFNRSGNPTFFLVCKRWNKIWNTPLFNIKKNPFSFNSFFKIINDRFANHFGVSQKIIMTLELKKKNTLVEKVYRLFHSSFYFNQIQKQPDFNKFSYLLTVFIEISLFTAITKPKWLRDIPEHFKTKRSFARLVLEHQGKALKYLPHFQKDSEMVLIAARNNLTALLYSSDEVRRNRAVIQQLRLKAPRA